MKYLVSLLIASQVFAMTPKNILEKVKSLQIKIDESLCEVPLEQRTMDINNVEYLVICETKDLTSINDSQDSLSKNYILARDIDLSSYYEDGGREFRIGSGKLGLSEEKFFVGIFNGNGHSISGFQYHKYSQKTYFTGLFGGTIYAVIKNLIVKDSHVSGGKYASPFIGKAFYTRVENVIVLNSTAKGHIIVGGLIGSTYKNPDDQELLDHYDSMKPDHFSVDDVGIYSSFFSGALRSSAHVLGGIVGHNQEKIQDTTSMAYLASKGTATGYAIGRHSKHPDTGDYSEFINVSVAKFPVKEKKTVVVKPLVRFLLGCEPGDEGFISYRFCLTDPVRPVGNYYNFPTDEAGIKVVDQKIAEEFLASIPEYTRQDLPALKSWLEQIID